MSVCLIGLGSNQGNRQAHLQAAIRQLQRCPDLCVLACSAWRETEPVGGPTGQDRFLNGAITVETALGPHAFLGRLQEIENRLGRERFERWGPRPIDLDLLLYDDLVLQTPSLVLPHPRMAWRRFVLEPAAEVAGEMRHPIVGWTVGQLLQHLRETARYIAITGPIAAGKSWLAERLSAAISGRWIVEEPNWSRLEAFYADPTSNGWETELEFLEQRSRMLAAAAFGGRGEQWSVSDFWFDQSTAFAEAWLQPGQFEQYCQCYDRLRPSVVQPRLVVWLDLPVENLLTRIQRRGRGCEQHLTAGQLERIRDAIARQVSKPEVGPVLQANNGDPDKVFGEVVAAVQGME